MGVSKMKIGSICLDLVVEAINRYEQAKSLMQAIEVLLDPILRSYGLEFSFREDQFEPIWQAKSGELMRFSVYKSKLTEDTGSFLYLIIKSDGTIVLEKRDI